MLWLSALVGAEHDVVTLARLVFEQVFIGLDGNGRLFLVGYKAFWRILATDGIGFTLEVPEIEVAADFTARSWHVEDGIVHESTCSVVEYELVTPSFVIFLGNCLVRHKVVHGERPVSTLWSGNFCGMYCRRNEKEGTNPQSKIFYL